MTDEGRLFHRRAAATAKKEALQDSSETVNNTSSNEYFNLYKCHHN